MTESLKLHREKLNKGARGNIEMYVGPMFADKTSTMIRMAKRLIGAGIPTLVVKHPLDARYGSGATEARSHNGDLISCEAYDHPFLVYKRVQEINPLVLIWDEVQFYTGLDMEMVLTLQKLVDEGRDVHLFGLERDFRGELFGPMGVLMANADMVNKLTGRCGVCNSLVADRTQRLIDGKPASYNSPVILVGAEEEGYQCRCKDCLEIPDAPRFEDYYQRYYEKSLSNQV